ncbi:hypothetical protein [Streptomyces sp. NPDC050546]
MIYHSMRIKLKESVTSQQFEEALEATPSHTGSSALTDVGF